MGDFLSFAKDTWKKTYGEKALFWRAYGFVLGVLILAVFLPIAVLVAYFHYFSVLTFANTSVTVILVSVLTVIAVVGLFYNLILLASLPYLVLRFLRHEQEGVSFSVTARKALVHKWAIFANWFLFSLIFGFIHVLLKHWMTCDGCIILRSTIFTLMHLILSMAILDILDKNETAFVAFANAWKYFIQNFLDVIMVVIWCGLLSIFSLITLFIGSVWTVPAQYNAIVLLYERFRGNKAC